jgi:hypothetical protein
MKLGRVTSELPASFVLNNGTLFNFCLVSVSENPLAPMLEQQKPVVYVAENRSMETLAPPTKCAQISVENTIVGIIVVR